MAVTLNSAGIQFSDSTTQNSAATGGASIAATQVTGYSNFYQQGQGGTARNTPTGGVLTVGGAGTAVPFQHNYTNQLFVGFQYYYTATQQDVRYYSRTHYRTVS
jgi:hypothetical protein